LRFFFQAEDGIRDFHVTGVPCALPILLETTLGAGVSSVLPPPHPASRNSSVSAAIRMPPILSASFIAPSNSVQRQRKRQHEQTRSEERRVGKERRSGPAPGATAAARAA